MRRVRYSVAMSFDGYIADPHGGYDWIVMDPEIDFDALLKDFDTILIGRKSWETTRKQGGGGGPMPGMKTFVFSRSLQQQDPVYNSLRISPGGPGNGKPPPGY